MAIEFRCTQCSKLLRTGDDTAGKQARCPECGAVSTIPPAGTPPAEPPDSRGGDPFAPAGPKPPAFDPENPYAPPTEYGVAAPSYPPIPGALTPTTIDLGDVFSRTWAIFKNQWAMCLVVVLLVGAISFAVNMAVTFGIQAVGIAANDPIIAGVSSVMGNLVSSLFGMWIGLGQSLFFLKTARGQQANLGDIFAGGPYFLRFLLAVILVGLIVLPVAIVCFGPAGLVLAISGEPAAALVVLVAGAVVFLVAYVFILLVFSQIKYLILDQYAGPIEALSLSKAIMTGNKVTVFLIALVEIALVVLGVAACCVGLLAAVPFVTLLAPVTYLAMTGQRTADQMLPGGATTPSRPTAP